MINNNCNYSWTKGKFTRYQINVPKYWLLIWHFIIVQGYIIFLKVYFTFLFNYFKLFYIQAQILSINMQCPSTLINWLILNSPQSTHLKLSIFCRNIILIKNVIVVLNTLYNIVVAPVNYKTNKCHLGFIEPLLCWKPVITLSRLTYCAFLCHGGLQLYTVGSIRTPFHASYYNLVRYCRIIHQLKVNN